jgi:WD40 repeat protein
METHNEISGHSSIINSVSIRQQRPLRAATGSDDSSIVFLHGAPFKFATKVGDMHKGYVYGVAFSPDGSTLVSVGADKRIQLYDGKTGEALKQIGEGEHTGSIFGVSWSKDSKRFATASADQTVKIWDVESGKSVQTWKLGSAGKTSVPDQQVGIVWPAGRNDGLIISLNLAGDLNYLVEGSDKPIKIVQGHNRNITALALSHNLLWTGSFDGRICQWNISEGKGVAADLQAHTNQIIAFASASEHVYSVGWDDTLRSSGKEAVKLSAQPKGIASVGDNIYVASPEGIEIFSDSKPVLLFATSAPSLNSKLANTSLDGSATKQIKSSYQYTPTTIAASNAFLAVGSDANEVHIYRGGDHTFNAIEKLQNSNASISALVFSPSGDLLAAGNTSGKITVYNTSSWEVVTDRWSAHTSRVSSIAWNEAGTHAVSGGLDTNIFVWSLSKPGSRVKAPNAHKDGVNGVCWVDGAIVSTGGDAAVKVWKVEKLT